MTRSPLLSLWSPETAWRSLAQPMPLVAQWVSPCRLCPTPSPTITMPTVMGTGNLKHPKRFGLLPLSSSQREPYHCPCQDQKDNSQHDLGRRHMFTRQSCQSPIACPQCYRKNFHFPQTKLPLPASYLTDTLDMHHFSLATHLNIGYTTLKQASHFPASGYD